jgi:hypothetical protein
MFTIVWSNHLDYSGVEQRLPLASMLSIAFRNPPKTSQPKASLDQASLPKVLGALVRARIATKRSYANFAMPLLDGCSVASTEMQLVHACESIDSKHRIISSTCLSKHVVLIAQHITGALYSRSL